MKELGALVVLTVFVLTFIPAFAQDGGGKGHEKTLFQLIMDSMDKPVQISEKDRVKPIDEVPIFQSMADGIKEGSTKAKDLSLRGDGADK